MRPTVKTRHEHCHFHLNDNREPGKPNFFKFQKYFTFVVNESYDSSFMFWECLIVTRSTMRFPFESPRWDLNGFWLQYFVNIKLQSHTEFIGRWTECFTAKDFQRIGLNVNIFTLGFVEQKETLKSEITVLHVSTSKTINILNYMHCSNGLHSHASRIITFP